MKLLIKPGRPATAGKREQINVDIQGAYNFSKIKFKHFSRRIFKLFQHLTAVVNYIYINILYTLEMIGLNFTSSSH